MTAFHGRHREPRQSTVAGRGDLRLRRPVLEPARLPAERHCFAVLRPLRRTDRPAPEDQAAVRRSTNRRSLAMTKRLCREHCLAMTAYRSLNFWKCSAKLKGLSGFLLPLRIHLMRRRNCSASSRRIQKSQGGFICRFSPAPTGF